MICCAADSLISASGCSRALRSGTASFNTTGLFPSAELFNPTTGRAMSKRRDCRMASCTSKDIGQDV